MVKRMNYGSETPFEVLGSLRGIDNESVLFFGIRHGGMGEWGHCREWVQVIETLPRPHLACRLLCIEESVQWGGDICVVSDVPSEEVSPA